jgi:cysteine-rich repeat protein
VRWLLVLATLAGCIDPSLVLCADGRACPRGTVCAPVPYGCVPPEQMAACEGSLDAEACMADPQPCATSTLPEGVCHLGVCVPAGCGNAVCEPARGELCDDGNTLSGDGCSADCSSREVCGDGYADARAGEDCDDGNFVGRDGCTAACTRELMLWSSHSGAPHARVRAAAGYDPLREQLVVFGGVESDWPLDVPYGDTWIWTGGSWVSPALDRSPAARRGAAMTYDLAHRRLVMFGGLGAHLTLLDDTWAWTGVSWQRLSPAVEPPSRFAAALASDGRRLLLFGGSRLGGGELDDTWAFDGLTWTEVVTANRPQARMHHSLVYDARHDRFVLFGGDSEEVMPDTWVFDGSDWSPLATAVQPDVRSGPLVYDAVRGVVVLNGARGTGGAMWELEGAIWREVPEGATDSPGMTGAAAAFDLARGQIVRFGGTSADTGASDELWTWDGDAWAMWAPASPTARCPAAMASDPVRGRVVLFGGQRAAQFSPCGGSVFDDTWEWDGRGWLLREGSASTPPARARAAMAFDGTRIVLFGGANSGGPLANAGRGGRRCWA